MDAGRIVASGTHPELVATSQIYNEILAAAIEDDEPEDTVS